MSRRPLLFFPTPTTTNPAKRNGGGTPPNIPTVTRQFERLGPKFSRLEDAIENRRIEIQNDIPGIDPEYTVVIETFGSVADFFKAVRKIEGLEWLGEHELRGIEPDEDFYSSRSDISEALNGQVMLMLSDRRAIDELLSLWRQYGQDPNMQFMRGWAKFRDLFRLLKDIRYWGAQDRLRNTGILEYWEDRLEYEPDTSVRFETELWYRKSEAKRSFAFENVSRLTRELGGQVLSTCCLPEISYQSLLLELPAGQVNRILGEEDVSLIKCDQVMLFRPLGQIAVEPLWNVDDAAFEEEAPEPDRFLPVDLPRLPRIALFDGLPLANHSDLQGYLIIDDPDGFEEGYLSQYRIHGTAMASLIVNGDLAGNGGKLTTPLYVRPIMKPDPHTYNNVETLPDNELPLDIIHRAVRRLFEGDGEMDPVAPSIKVINLSIGDPNIQFSGRMSPFARLVDWLSFKYNVLFIVSSGNHSKDVTVSQSGREFDNLPDDHKSVEFFKAVQSDSWDRKLLSPAESVNALTVGSLHSDESTPVLRPGLYNFYNEEMPAAYSGQGSGYLRAVKPDVAISGGRMLYNEAIGHSNLTSVSNYAAPGHHVAHPHQSALNYRVYTRGTSNSAALASRGCAEICDVLEELFASNHKQEEFELYAPYLLKSLLTHGASWGEMYHRINNLLEDQSSNSVKNVIAKHIGYGKPDIDRVTACLDTRATILGYGGLLGDEAHVYRLPIPESMGGANIWRRLTVTLSWFAKPNPESMKYRDSALWFTVEGDNKHLASRSPLSAQWQQVLRGTLQHEVFEGDDLAVLTDDKMLEIKVSCKEHASKINEPVKYGLAITLEVANGVEMQLYQEIQGVINEQIINQERVSVPTR